MCKITGTHTYALIDQSLSAENRWEYQSYGSTHCTRPGQGQAPISVLWLYTLHETGTGTGTEKWWVSILHHVLFTLHRGRDRYIGTIVFYCAHPVHYPCPWPGPLQCVWAITERDETRWWQKGWWLHSGKLLFIFLDCACTDFFNLSLSALEKIFLPVMSLFCDCAEYLLFIKLSNALHSQLQQSTALTMLQPLLRPKICM